MGKRTWRLRRELGATSKTEAPLNQRDRAFFLRGNAIKIAHNQILTIMYEIAGIILRSASLPTFSVNAPPHHLRCAHPLLQFSSALPQL